MNSDLWCSRGRLCKLPCEVAFLGSLGPGARPEKGRGQKHQTPRPLPRQAAKDSYNGHNSAMDLMGVLKGGIKSSKNIKRHGCFEQAAHRYIKWPTIRV